jgi:hypothetical protein
MSPMSKLKPKQITFKGLAVYQTNQQALDDSLPVGAVYKTLSGTLKVVYS